MISDTSTADFPSSPTTDDLRRCGYQLLRTTRENGPKTKSAIFVNLIDGIHDPKETIRDLSYCEKIYYRILKELSK